jgi:type IV secretion system protein VirD4
MAERAGLFDFKGKAAEKAERERQQAAEQAERDRIAAEKAAREAAEKAEQIRLEAIRNEPLIRVFYDNRMNVFSRQSDLVEDQTTRLSSPPKVEEQIIKFRAKFKLSRAFSSMKTYEITPLKYAHLLNNYGLLSADVYGPFAWAMVYNNGNCEYDFEIMELRRAYCEDYGLKNNLDGVRHVLARWGISTPEAGLAVFLSTFSKIEREHPTHHIVQEFRSMLIGGNGWLTEQNLSSSPLSVEPSASGLFIGDMETGPRLWFDGEASLITIAPPGSGKTQCHVFPNLLNFKGSAVVLDVKGECFSETAAWRKKNCGPVYKFNPLNPAESARYNPLAFIENDPDTLWEDCRLLADLLIVPENRQDASWENRGRDVVTGVIAWLVRTQAPEDRRMGRIVDIVSKIDWENFVNEAKYVMDVPPLSRLGNALAVMPERQLEGVLDAARRHLAIWEGARVERVTAACDWTADVLRDGSNSTVYICIPPNEIETYAPLLRVIFAQHLRQLMKKLPERGTHSPILFMLDELPRLGQMRPVEEALEVGRQYGIRLWMFAQSLGQLERAYTNAEGMVGSCGIRIYMNPSAHDGTTKRLSEELGEVESVVDNSRQPMATPSDLAGPKYANLQIVFTRNSYPAKLKKVFAHSDPTFKARLAENATLSGKS